MIASPCQHGHPGRPRRVRPRRGARGSGSSRASTCWSAPGTTPRSSRFPTGHVVVSTDLLVEGRHFRRDWASPLDIGHRAAAQNLSDINAMGGGGHRADRRAGRAAGPARRLGARARRRHRRGAALVGASVVGGDVTARRPGGDRGHRARCRRRRAGTTVGRTAWGRRGARRPPGLGRRGSRGAGRGFRSPRVLVEAYRRPSRRTAPGRRRALGATAMIDVSDGLLADVGPRRRGERGRDRRPRGAFEVAEPLQAVGAALGRRPDAVHPRRRRRPRARGDLPGRGTVPEGWRWSARSPRARASRSTAPATRARPVDALLTRARTLTTKGAKLPEGRRAFVEVRAGVSG